MAPNSKSMMIHMLPILVEAASLEFNTENLAFIILLGFWHPLEMAPSFFPLVS